MKNVEKVVIWFAVDENGDEGVMAMGSPTTGLMMPLFCTAGSPSEAYIDRMAREIAHATGQIGRKAAFRRVADLEETGENTENGPGEG